MGKAAYGGSKMRGKMAGKMGKHRGKGGMRVVDIDNWKELTDPAIRRLLRKGGTNADIYEEARDVTKGFLTMILKDAIAYTDHARRKTTSSTLWIATRSSTTPAAPTRRPRRPQLGARARVRSDGCTAEGGRWSGGAARCSGARDARDL